MMHRQNRSRWIALGLSVPLAILLIFSLKPGLGQAITATAQSTAPFFQMEIDLEAGQTVNPTYTQIGSDREINFSIAVSGTTSVELVITNGGGESWRGVASGGETLWGTTTLTAGSNQFSLQNSGAATAQIEFQLFTLAEAPYLWQGTSLADGQSSNARVHFAQSGLYLFDFGVNNGSRYEFLLDERYIRKMVTGPTSVAYYVEAGTHDVQLIQDSGGSAVAWQVDIQYSGLASDALPYQKSGDEIDEEWLPIFIDSATPVNLVISTTQSLSATLTVQVMDGARSPIAGSNRVVIGGETLWSTFNLAQGINLIHLTAQEGAVDYSLMADAVPAAPYIWQGMAASGGEESRARVLFPTDGLYTFDFGNDGGRYQFQVGEQFIQKTVEAQTQVAYFVPAGIHPLAIVPDAAQGASWSVTISEVDAAADALPYTKKGGSLGGVDNGFTEEWLPVALPTATHANISVKTTGTLSDTLRLDFYPIGSDTPSASYEILGGEKAWTTFPLNAGVNRIHLTATGNNGPMTYDLALRPMPGDGEASWDGVTRAGAHHSTITVFFPREGAYAFALQSEAGFANLLLDDVDLSSVSSPPAQGTSLTPTARRTAAVATSYERFVSAGLHEIRVVQDPSFPVTRWKATVTEVGGSADNNFLAFTGTLAAGATINQLYGGLAEPLDFNFSMAVSGSDVALEMIGGGAPLWQETILDGETIWGTATLTELNQIRLSEASGATANIELDLAYLPGVDALWQGTSNPNSVDSRIRVDFPSAGLHTFTFGEGGSGRYQFLVNDKFIQKTVEADTEVTYFVPAGVHDLTIHPDNGVGADWSVAISATDAATDTLPYTKAGGGIGGADNEFAAEWLPIHLESDTRVNVVITATGSTSDSLRLQIWDGVTSTLTAQPLWGTETVWATTLLPQDGRLHLLADPQNGDELRYEIAIHPIPEIGYTWTGQSLAAGIHPEVQLIAPVKGIYRVAVAILEGFIDFGQIGAAPPLQQRQGDGNIFFDLPLEAGVYSFVGQQSRDLPVSRWAVDVSLLTPAALVVAAVEPDTVMVGQAQTVVITGENFVDPVVHLRTEEITHTLEILSVTPEIITVALPGSLPVAVYDLMVVDSDGRQVNLPDLFTVEGAFLYLPSIRKQ